ncbi:MAG: L-glutamate gamma-semialdehyde dehydrogenase [Proteobacteria bacterium]|nr:L-glutamate gamma-semialdehyde dehydrogenase [Pseudomonadota bacterium]MBU1583367.1 L-glutamate gamma-semialdehyde dehydrogenase [Pseudomonadota bacterium]MBU2631492.1 L-glutamate gamma-semialdehyde dehydrogenase [Pseudomonadota bacterium]
MNNSIPTLPEAYTEPIKSYLPGSSERQLLENELNRQLDQVIDIPLIINGQKIRTPEQHKVVCPHDHAHLLATFCHAQKKEIDLAIDAALTAKPGWEAMPWQERASIFLKAADLISQKYTYVLNTATMLGQSKNAFQAEIDATCELVDFLRFNAIFMEQIYKHQPKSEKGVWNRTEYRALEGFVFALTPFNFTAIAGNLCAAPAIMGNTIVWKPSSNAVLSGYYLMKIFKEAGLPDGVINFIPGKGSRVGEIVLNHKDLAGIHFTGSTRVFQTLWKKVGANIETYASYPRIVGETGGKDFIFMHPSADTDQVVAAAIRGAFEYQGQKCSACSRMYVPRSRWDEVEHKIKAAADEIKPGSVMEFKNFMTAVIDEAAFDKSLGFIERAKASGSARILSGGTADKTKGFFIDPTLIVTDDPCYESMTQEIFAPILTLYVYEDETLDATLELVDKTSVYALTGAVFATDRQAIHKMTKKLAHCAGNFYINDKPTGAVVGHQPFGGARASGTNDKAGSFLNLLRWTSARTIKENFVPPGNFHYPFMTE